MAWRGTVGRNWNRLRDSMKREFLREPHRVLLDRALDGSSTQPEKAVAVENR